MLACDRSIGSILLVFFSLSLGLPGCEKSSGADVHRLPETVPTEPESHSKPAEDAGTSKRPQGKSASLPEPASAQGAQSRYNATTAAHRTSTISPTVPGLIETMHVKEGDRVSKGTVLATLDSKNSELRLRQARSGVRMARAQLKAAKTESKRAKKLHKDKAIPGAQLDRTTAHVDVAAAGVAQARTGVAMAEKALEDVIIRAPFDGVVARRMASEGEFASSMPPKMLVTIQEVSPIDLRVTIPAGAANLVHVGTPLMVYFGGDRSPRESVVARISPAFDPTMRSLTVIAELENSDGALLPGMFAEVEVTAGSSAKKKQGPTSP